jgi:tetratricopeptide (TPR) repeat protein
MLPVQRLFQREDVQEALRSAGLGVPLQAEPGGTIVFKLFEGVPPRDRGFTGREALLAKLHAALTDANLPPAATQVVAVNGPPGVGKTSLAAEYAHRKAPEFAGVWWAPAEGRALLIASLAALALRLEPSLASERDQEKVAQAGLASLAKSPRPLLLVYDNAQTPGALRGLVPPAGARVLVTTRWSDWGGQAKEVYADVLAPDAAVAFLQQRADRTDPMGAARLANELGNLPLALDHAGAYCRRSGLSFDEYRRAIDVHIADAPRGEPDRASVAATFSLAIARAAKEQPEAEALLASMAFLAPDRIPLDLLNVGIVDEKRRADALSVLFEVSLVRHVRLDDGAAAVALHRLVQTAARTRLAACGETKAWINLTTRCLQNSFPATAYHDVETWPTCAVLIPHVLALRDHLRAEPSSAELARLVNAAGRYLHRRGSYFEAEELYKQSIAASEEALGHGHTDVARARNNLGHLYRDTGRFAQAESLYKEAIFIGERTLGRPSPEVAAWLNNLANLYRVLKRFDEAEPLVTEAIDITERAHGRRHREVALLVAHLAALRRDMNRTREAEPLYREAISIGEATLGREHPDVATWLNSLAELYRRNKRFNEAEPLYREAISIGEATLGREHPDVAEWRENLSGLLAVMRDGKDDAPSNALS